MTQATIILLGTDSPPHNTVANNWMHRAMEQNDALAILTKKSMGQFTNGLETAGQIFVQAQLQLLQTQYLHTIMMTKLEKHMCMCHQCNHPLCNKILSTDSMPLEYSNKWKQQQNRVLKLGLPFTKAPLNRKCTVVTCGRCLSAKY